MIFQKALFSFWLVLFGCGRTSRVLLVSAYVCNACGCDGCTIGVPLAIVIYPNPSDPTTTQRNNCQTIWKLAANDNNPFSRQQCLDLYKYVTPNCACITPDGDDVRPYGFSEEPTEAPINRPSAGGGGGDDYGNNQPNSSPSGGFGIPIGGSDASFARGGSSSTSGARARTMVFTTVVMAVIGFVPVLARIV